MYSIIKIVITFEQWNNYKKHELLELVKKLNLENETNKQIKTLVQGRYRNSKIRNEQKQIKIIKDFEEKLAQLEKKYKIRHKKLKQLQAEIQTVENDISNLLNENLEVEEDNERSIVNVRYNPESGYIGINETKYVVTKLIAQSNVAAKHVNNVINSVFLYGIFDMNQENLPRLYDATTYMRWINSYGEKLLNYQCL